MPTVSVSVTTSAYSEEKYFLVRVDPTDRFYPSILIEGPLAEIDNESESMTEERIRLLSLKLLQDAEKILKSHTKEPVEEKHDESRRKSKASGKSKIANTPRQKASSSNSNSRDWRKRFQSKRSKG